MEKSKLMKGKGSSGQNLKVITNMNKFEAVIETANDELQSQKE